MRTTSIAGLQRSRPSEGQHQGSPPEGRPSVLPRVYLSCAEREAELYATERSRFGLLFVQVNDTREKHLTGGGTRISGMGRA